MNSSHESIVPVIELMPVTPTKMQTRARHRTDSGHGNPRFLVVLIILGDAHNALQERQSDSSEMHSIPCHLAEGVLALSWLWRVWLV